VEDYKAAAQRINFASLSMGLEPQAKLEMFATNISVIHINGL
jgi:hypothetical protein